MSRQPSDGGEARSYIAAFCLLRTLANCDGGNMEDWFDQFTRALARWSPSRRSLLQSSLAIGGTSFARSFLAASVIPPLVSVRALAQPAPGTCQTSRSGAARSVAVWVGDRLAAGPITLRSSITFAPGRKTMRSAGWAVTAEAFILQGQRQILHLKASAETGDSQLELDLGDGFSGAKGLRLDVRSDRRSVTGSIDGRQLAPFSMGAEPKFADGTRVPVILIDPGVKSALGRVSQAGQAAHNQCGHPRIESNTACDECSLVCGAKFYGCLYEVAGGAIWELPSCFSNLNDCYDACNTPGNACCSARCDVDGGCCVDNAVCCGSGPTAHCCAPGQPCCNGNCCPSGEVCANPGQNYSLCCQPSDFVCHGEMCCPPGGQCCGDSGCCVPGTHCADPRFGLCCPDDSVSCGANGCCGPQSVAVCLNGTLCCNKNDLCGSTCCPGGPCINGTCCPPPSHACGNSCCKPLNVCCGTVCCDQYSVCLSDRNGPIGCCPASLACGVGGDNPVCCPTGQQCIDQHESICAACPSGQVSCVSQNANGPDTTVCCAPGVSCCNGQCCKPSEICCTNLHLPPLVFGCHPGTLCVQ
jgi:hypothetical protein